MFPGWLFAAGGLLVGSCTRDLVGFIKSVAGALEGLASANETGVLGAGTSEAPGGSDGFADIAVLVASTATIARKQKSRHE